MSKNKLNINFDLIIEDDRIVSLKRLHKEHKKELLDILNSEINFPNFTDLYCWRDHNDDVIILKAKIKNLKIKLKT